MAIENMYRKGRNNNASFRGRGMATRGRGGLGGRMAGTVRRGPFSVNVQSSPHTIAKSMRRAKSFPWQQDLFEDSLRATEISGQESGTKLYISNLDHGVTNDDIRELFADLGELKRHTVHYDKNGRSSGSAEVVYTRRSDAFAALKRYNNVQLDGKLMKIEIIGANSEVPVSARVSITGQANGKRTVVMTSGVGRGRGNTSMNRGSGAMSRGGFRNSVPRGGSRSVPRGGRGGGRGGGRSFRGGGGGGGSRGRGRKQTKSVDELDKELESYHSEAMNTS